MCEHVYGFNDEYEGFDGVHCARLVYIKTKTLDIPFTYCPLCGERLTKEDDDGK